MKTAFKASLFLRGTALSAVLLATLSGCTTERQIRGYFEDKNVTNAIEPGIDNVNSVRSLLGNPTIDSTFNPNIWYYISSHNERKSFFFEQPNLRSILAIHFSERGIVDGVKRYSLADAHDIDPVKDTTPTRGKQLGFFEQIFGNVGRFAGAPGAGGPPR